MLKIIDNSIDRFESLSERNNRYKNVVGTTSAGKLSKFIVALPSSSPLNTLLVSRMKLKYPHIMDFGTFEKLMTDELVLNMEKVDSEQSSRDNRERIIKYYNNVKSAHGGKPFEVKFISASFRRYFYNFLTFKHDVTKKVFNSLTKESIMFVDDTIGEGNTLKEAIRVLKIGQYVPSRIFCYAFLRDFNK